VDATLQFGPATKTPSHDNFTLTLWHKSCFWQGAPVNGTIRSRHLLTHAPLIVRLFGFRAYLRCIACVVRRPGRATFLSALGDSLMN
jgi:hypothetical protein